MVTGFPSCNTHISFEVADSMFHDGSYFIEGIPIIRIPLDAGEHVEVHVGVSINGAPFLGTAVGIFAVTDPFPLSPCVLLGGPICPGQSGLFCSSARHISCQGCAGG